MTELLTAAQMRAIEQVAIESGEVTGFELMERAGHGVVEAVFEEWPELREGVRRAVVLCGPGNNGGDGFVVARLLKKAGWQVDVFLYGDAEKLPPDARVNFEKWEQLGEVSDLSNDPDILRREPDLVVDALFGIGLNRPVSGLEDLFLELNEDTGICRKLGGAGYRVTAIDCPTGLCGDSGVLIDDVGRSEHQHWFQPRFLAARLTVTFHSLKVGHCLADGSDVCGKLSIFDIGLAPSSARRTLGIGADTKAGVHPDFSAIAHMVTHNHIATGSAVHGAKLSKGAGFGSRDHKFDHGHALILSGGPAKTGAARLAARGALRGGAGLVTLGVPPAAQMEVAAQVTAVMIQRVADAEALGVVLGDARINALCLGPALGLSEERVDLIATALASGRPCVIDADALTLIARSPALFAQLHGGCVLTPHGGEFARLFPDIAERLKGPATKGPAYSKVDATRDAAKRAGCTVLFKGPDTVIASPDGTAAINASVYDRAAPWLATAGSGDVLAGFITGLLARGFPPQQAAEAGAWLHTECALSFGPGLIAEDLPDQLPAVFKALDI